MAIKFGATGFGRSKSYLSTAIQHRWVVVNRIDFPTSLDVQEIYLTEYSLNRHKT